MLTNTDYVKSGAIWPPRSESERLAEMRTNWELHNGDFKSLFPGAKAPDRLDENDFKLVSRTWRDLMFDRSPALGMADGSPAAPFLEAASSALIAAGRQALINVIRYGVGPVFVRRNTIEAIDPRYWFPVVDLSDEGVRTADVVAYPYRRDPESGPGTADRIRLYILEAGTCRVLDFSFAGAVLGDQQQLDEFPCTRYPIPTVRLDDDSIYGSSLYTDIAPFVAELQRRGSSVSHALDRNANPHLAVPEGSLHKDANGRVTLNQDGMAIFVPEGSSTTPAYVTWDAKFEEHRHAIERAVTGILRHSAIAPVLADPTQQTGSIPSGAALRRLSMLTLMRARTLQRVFSSLFSSVFVSWMDQLRANSAPFADPGTVITTWPRVLSAGLTDDADGLGSLVDRGIITAERAREIIGEADAQGR